MLPPTKPVRAPPLTHDEFHTMLVEAIQTALERFHDDDDFHEKFWKRGFAELSRHTSDASTQWIGRKIMVAVATTVLGWLLIYVLRNGGLK